VWSLTRAASRRLLIWGALPICVVTLLAAHNHFVFAQRFTVAAVMPLACGSLLAYHERQTCTRTAAKLGAAIMLLGLAVWSVRDHWLLGMLARWVSMTGFACGAVMVCLGYVEPTCARALRRVPRLTDLGVMTYGIYLFHAPIYAALAPRRGPLVWLLAVGLTLAAAVVSYLLLERPLIRWASHRFRRRYVALTPVVSAA
jgi:peptidoglycan/LPS O-acetylase OafA/YrhL